MAKRIRLICHPDTPARLVDRVEVGFGISQGQFEYRVFARGGLALPAAERPERGDELWKMTCFELFAQPEPGPGYQEYNFSPSRRWAAYDFKSYRSGRRDLEIMAPKIDFRSDITGCALRVELDLAATIAFPGRYGLSAIIEEVDGTKSYWALAHSPGEPDFHNPNCFAIELPALV